MIRMHLCFMPVMKIPGVVHCECSLLRIITVKMKADFNRLFIILF